MTCVSDPWEPRGLVGGAEGSLWYQSASWLGEMLQLQKELL